MTILYPSWKDYYSFRIYPPLFDSKFKKELPDQFEMDWWRMAIDPDYYPEVRYKQVIFKKVDYTYRSSNETVCCKDWEQVE